jgi:hypothetical protein
VCRRGSSGCTDYFLDPIEVYRETTHIKGTALKLTIDHLKVWSGMELTFHADLWGNRKQVDNKGLLFMAIREARGGEKRDELVLDIDSS